MAECVSGMPCFHKVDGVCIYQGNCIAKKGG
jgi:hypothetical protein